MLVLTIWYAVNCSLVFRTPVSARSYRASAFLLDLPLFCQANRFIHSFIHSFIQLNHVGFGRL